MADDNFNPADNLDEEARIKGGQNSPTNFKNRSESEVENIASEGGSAGGSGNRGSSADMDNA